MAENGHAMDLARKKLNGAIRFCVLFSVLGDSQASIEIEGSRSLE